MWEAYVSQSLIPLPATQLDILAEGNLPLEQVLHLRPVYAVQSVIAPSVSQLLPVDSALRTLVPSQSAHSVAVL